MTINTISWRSIGLWAAFSCAPIGLIGSTVLLAGHTPGMTGLPHKAWLTLDHTRHCLGLITWAMQIVLGVFSAIGIALVCSESYAEYIEKRKLALKAFGDVKLTKAALSWVVIAKENLISIILMIPLVFISFVVVRSVFSSEINERYSSFAMMSCILVVALLFVSFVFVGKIYKFIKDPITPFVLWIKGKWIAMKEKVNMPSVNNEFEKLPSIDKKRLLSQAQAAGFMSLTKTLKRVAIEEHRQREVEANTNAETLRRTTIQSVTAKEVNRRL